MRTSVPHSNAASTLSSTSPGCSSGTETCSIRRSFGWCSTAWRDAPPVVGADGAAAGETDVVVTKCLSQLRFSQGPHGLGQVDLRPGAAQLSQCCRVGGIVGDQQP